VTVWLLWRADGGRADGGHIACSQSQPCSRLHRSVALPQKEGQERQEGQEGQEEEAPPLNVWHAAVTSSSTRDGRSRSIFLPGLIM